MYITIAISEFSVLYTIPTVLNQSFKFLGNLKAEINYSALNKEYVELSSNNNHNKTFYYCIDSIINKLG